MGWGVKMAFGVSKHCKHDGDIVLNEIKYFIVFHELAVYVSNVTSILHMCNRCMIYTCNKYT